MRKIVRWGVGREKTIEGGTSTGVLSFADLEANFQGFRLVRSLCADDGRPSLARGEGGIWVLSGRVDIRDYINPDWDEAFNPSFYIKRRWRNVRERMTAHCDKLSLPEVVERFRDYRERYRPSSNAQILRELESEGRLPSREAYSLRAVCEEANEQQTDAPR